MEPGSRARHSLASKVVQRTLAIGAFTITLAAAVAIVPTSRLTSEASRNRDLRTLQIVEDRVERDLRHLAAGLEQACGQSRDTDVLVERLQVLKDNLPGHLNRILVVNRSGQVVTSIPPTEESLGDVRAMPAYLSALAGRSGFVSCQGVRPGTWELWMARTAVQKSGKPLLILAEVDTSIVQQILSRSESDFSAGTLLLMDGRTVIGGVGEVEEASIRDARWVAEGQARGSIRLVSGDGVVMEGHYNDIGGLEGVGWRAVIVAPASHHLLEALRTLGPPVLVLLGGGAVALTAAWGLSLRLSRPLRQLERAALAAASGSYARQLSSNRDDEIGRVSQAFNAVALRLNALHDLAQLLAAASSLDQVLDGIVAATGRLVGPGSAAVYLLEEGGRMLAPVRTVGPHLESARVVEVEGDSWLAEVWDKGQLVTHQGFVDEPNAADQGDKPGALQLVAAPLTVGGQALGVIVVARDYLMPFTAAEAEMLRTFSAQAAVAVQTSRSFEQEHAARRNAEALRAVAEGLVRPSSLQAALNTVERIVRDLFSARDVIIALVDRSALGISAAHSPVIEKKLLHAALANRDCKEGPCLVTRGMDADLDEVLDDLGVSRVLLAPIGLRGDHGAVLAIALGDAALPDQAMDSVRALCDEIALALDNAYFYERALRRAGNLETIFRISQAVGSPLQINVVLNRVLDVVQKILSADGVLLLSYDARKRVLTTAMGRGRLPKEFLHMELPPGLDVPGQVFVRGEPVLMRSLKGQSGVAGLAGDAGLGTLLAVPLLARGRSLGVLMVMATDPKAYAEEDMNTLQTFASQAALAIDTARLYSKEHEVASVLQQSILPDALPSFEELEADSVYEPAGADTEIGGDYYDLFRHKDGSIWFAIADVCGKGVYAATKTSMIKYSVRALVSAGQGPAAVISEVNNMIAETGDASDIVTLWVGRYDPLGGELRWANGGHPPGLLRRDDGSFTQLEATGALLGAVKDARYDERGVDFRPGEMVLLYTDGVTEARSGNIFYGEERVRSVFMEAANARNAAQNLLSSVLEYTRGELRDDVAILVIAPTDGRERRQGRDE